MSEARPPDDKPDTRPTPPLTPPEMPDEDGTRRQIPVDDTRGMERIDAPPRPKRQERPLPAPPSPPTTAPRPPTKRKAKPREQRSGLYLPVWSVGLMLLSVCGAVACLVFAVYSLGGNTPPPAAPRIVIATAVSTGLPGPDPALLASPTLPAPFAPPALSPFALQGPTLPPVVLSPTPTPRPQIAVGSTVIVVGDNGIRIRSTPGTDTTVLTVANPGEQFTVVAGPQQANNLTWWRISNPAKNIDGWAAENDGLQDLLALASP